MMMSVNTTFMAFRITKPSFQIKVVCGQIKIVTADKQTGGKTAHRLGHMAAYRMVVLFERLLKGPKGLFTLIDGAGRRIQCGGYLAHVFEVRFKLRLHPLDLFEAAIDASGQP
jgi:hypothetical protein